jgi:undecaprenyl diphosphate synthase
VALFTSSTRAIPQVAEIPRHIAIIMDGNGRWAKKRFLPRVAGHQRGLEAVRGTVKSCVDLGVEYLTLFAFSSENWRRPAEEVTFLMQLFLRALEQEVARLHKNNIRLRIIGDRSRFDDKLVDLINEAEQHTAGNSALTLTIAANYGGRWDIMQALRAMVAAAPGLAQTFSEEELAAHLSMSWAPEPDLFIRTGGEKRISNFLLWQLAYTELHFTDILWPDFNAAALKKAIHSYQQRERRFGRTSEQLTSDA